MTQATAITSQIRHLKPPDALVQGMDIMRDVQKWLYVFAVLLHYIKWQVTEYKAFHKGFLDFFSAPNTVR